MPVNWSVYCNAQCIICRHWFKTFKKDMKGEWRSTLYVLNRHFRLGLHYRTPTGKSEHIQPKGHAPRHYYHKDGRAQYPNLCTCPPGQRLWP